MPAPTAVRRAALVVCALGTAVLGAGCQAVDQALAPSPTSESRSVVGTTTIGPSADPATPTSWGPTVGELTEAAQLAADMSDEELAATVLMPGFWGYDGRSPSPQEAALNRDMHRAGTAARALAARSYGGVFLRPEVIQEAQQIDALTAVLHEEGGSEELPLLIGIDQEGGGVQRLQFGVDTVPSAQSVGASGRPAYARRVARANGRSLVDLGVTMVFAPVADYDPDGSSTLGSRTYSRDLDVTTRMVLASMKGYLDAGVLPVLKHFPGIGTVPGDSHGTLVHQRASMRQLQRRDLVPFRRAVEAGAPVVMTAHVAVDASDPKVAASVNPEVVQGMLRDDLGFEGVVVTDSQGMAPIFEPFGPGEGAVRSLLAGNDLVLNSPNPTMAFRHLQRALGSGRLSREQVVESATRVLALRLYLARLQEDRTVRSDG
jgi:beta-N-acetylhexosaminidase